jgi:uncharacterized protein (TIGR02271 family)
VREQEMAGPSREAEESWRDQRAEASPPDRRDASRAYEDTRPVGDPELEGTIELKEEQLVPHKEMRDVGEVVVRTEVEDFPRRLEVEALREEIEVEHVPIGQVVSERVAPWEEGDVLIVPVYEEQLVVTKRLLLREQLRVRRVGTTETRLFEDTVRQERVVIDDPSNSGLVRERFPVDEKDREQSGSKPGGASEKEPGGLLEKLGRRVLR